MTDICFICSHMNELENGRCEDEITTSQVTLRFHVDAVQLG